MKTMCIFLRRTVFVVLTIFSLGFFALESEDHIGNKADEQSMSFEYYAVPGSSVDELSNNEEDFFNTEASFHVYGDFDTESFDEEYWNQQEATADVFEDVNIRQYIVEFFDGEEFVLNRGLRNKAEEAMGDSWNSSDRYLEDRGVRPYVPNPWPCKELGDCAEDGVSPYVPSPWPCKELGDCAGDVVSPYAPSLLYDRAGNGIFGGFHNNFGS